MAERSLNSENPGLIESLPSIFLKPFSIGKSVRTRLTVTLCAVVVPALLIAIALAWHANSAARAVRLEAVRHDAQLFALEIDSSLWTDEYFGRSVAQFLSHVPKQQDRCGDLRSFSNSVSSRGLKAILVEGHRFPCGEESNDIGPAALASLRGQLTNGVQYPIAMAPGQDDGGVLGVPIDGQADALLLLFLPRDSLTGGTQLIADGADNVEIRDSVGQVLLADHLRVSVPRARFGGPERHVTAPVPGTELTVAVGYPASLFPLFDGKLFWASTIAIGTVLTLTLVAAVLAVDRALGRWIGYLCRIAAAHSKGRLSVRALRLDEAPRELAELGHAINSMAENISIHARMLETAVVEKETMLQELHHRVKNNFQIISSLLTLQRKALPPERAPDFRFVEDHVHAMAAAYRVAYSSPNITLVSPVQIAKDVVATLSDTAGLNPNLVDIHVEDDSSQVDLDKAINIGLTLAYLLPPRLDTQKMSMKPVKADIRVIGQFLVIRLDDIGPISDDTSSLRQRLAEAYVRQFQVTILVSRGDASAYTLRIPLNANAVATARESKPIEGVDRVGGERAVSP